MVDTKDTLVKTFGKENVIDDPDVLESYSKDESFIRPLKPWFAVKAQNSAQVQDLIQWANQTDTPLVPISSGPPHFRGDTVPSAPGAITVDMSGMKKIIHLDTRNRMVIVEPGVTFAQLQLELAKSGLRLSSPLAPRANKSVVASLLEKDPIVIPRYQWAALDPLRCLEIVWGDGQKMTTGEAGNIGSLQEEWDKKLAQANPAGPAQTDFYRIASAAQGSMGIVTWASLKCELLPKIHKLFFVPSHDLEALVNLAYSILRIRFGDELLLINNWNLALILGKESDRIQSLAKQLPQWMLLVGIAGRERLPEERVAFQEKDISEMAERHGLQFVPSVPGAGGDEVLEVILNPSREPYWKLGYGEGSQDIFFLSTLEKAPRFFKAMSAIAEGKGYPASEIGMYIQPIHQGASCHIEFNLPFSRNNPGEANRMKELYIKASEELLREGAYYSRPYGMWSELAFNRDAQSTRVLKKIKGIFDPRNVMNRGKLCF
jgi:FAD/FMN-containing dehydrogenase